jgi:hypothetical protein
MRAVNCLPTLASLLLAARALAGDVVVNQVYASGGAPGGGTHDFVEIKNISPQPVSIAGWSLHVNVPSLGSGWSRVTIFGSITLAPGQHLLVQLAGSGPALPGAEVFAGTVNLSPDSGRAALSRASGSLIVTCPTTLADRVSWGTGLCPETASTISPTATASLRRIGDCQDTDDNLADFALGPIDPRGRIAPPVSCFAPQATLTVNVLGGGRVVSTPAGIDCPSVCQMQADVGTAISLSPDPPSGLRFLEWADAPNQWLVPRTVTLTANSTLTARFWCFADITGIGGPPEPLDGQATVDDVIAFVNAFGDGCFEDPLPQTPCSLADLTGIGGPPEMPDGQLTVDDIIAFVNAFGDGCLN